MENSHYETNNFIDYLQAKASTRETDFIRRGDVISHNILNRYSKVDPCTERVIKLQDIRFGRPVQGLILYRPRIYGVTSRHYVAGYKIVIKRFQDTTDDTIWYETPIGSFHCKIFELEEIIHEHLLEAIQRDSKWEQIK